ASTADSSVAAVPTTVSTSSIAAVATPSVADPAVASPPQNGLVPSDISSSAAPLTTTGARPGTPATNPQAPDAAESTAGVNVVPIGGNGNGGGRPGSGSTIAVAGGVVGGVAVISLVAFLIWFWRRRMLRKRRSTLLTPLSADPGFGRDRQGGYMIERDSIGPTPRSIKVKVALRAQYSRVRGRIARSGSVRSISSSNSGRSVDLNRGNSQFMDSPPVVDRNRKNSSALPPGDSANPSFKDRITAVLAKLKGPQMRDPGWNENKNDIFSARGLGGSMKEKDNPRTRPVTNKPDFLTLLNMDDSELDREAQRRRVSRTRGGSDSSVFGGLNLNFGQDPFSDANALTSNNAKPAPFQVSGANNPFSDAYAIPGPTHVPQPASYVHDIRRSRGQSIGTIVDLNQVMDLRVVNGASRPPSGATARPGGYESTMYMRESTASFESFNTRRNKFRSDPFDLEPLSQSPSSFDRSAVASSTFSAVGSSGAGRYPSTSGSIPIGHQSGIGARAAPGGDVIRKPVPAAHARENSLGSSKYTSGVSEGSMDDWSDPGPDVGPRAVYTGNNRRTSQSS
ncbi:hypothetical protein diail_515, partial [Diaporthe ilicicola]